MRGRGPAGVMPSHHRVDIQGLRALAVLLVVAFHAGLPVPGGYVGVDVFFVISGFVITALLVRESSGAGISLRTFYVRRVRRLLPALALMTSITMVLAVLIASPVGERSQQYALGTGVAATLFSANWFLYLRGGGYFGPAEDSNPFLHTWSLSVEEQFYLVFPALVVAAVMWSVRRQERSHTPVASIALVVAAVSAVSLVSSWFLTSGRGIASLGSPERLAFFGTPSRVWEFGAGALLALFAQRGLLASLALARVASVTGALLLLWSALRFDDATPFPGISAMVPVAGAVLLLIAGATEPVTARLLSWAPLVRIGDLSYGWYLWHWPLIVFAGLLWPDFGWAPLIAAATAYGVAELSYRYVETPIRSDVSLVGRRVLRMAAVCVLVPLAVGAAGLVGASHRWGLEPPEQWAATGLARERGCHLGSDVEPVWSEDCLFSVAGSSGTILLLGDSHGASASTGVVEAGRSLGYDVAVWTRSACPFVRPDDDTDPSCARWERAAFDLVERLDPSLVVIANRSAAYAHLVEVREDDGTIVGGPQATRADRAAAGRRYIANLAAAVRTLTDQNIPVVIDQAVPEWASTFPTGEVSILRPSPRVPDLSVETLQSRRSSVVEAEVELAAGSDLVAAFDPFPWLCPDARCSPVRDGQWTYYDDNHVSEAGSRLLADGLADTMAALLDDVGEPIGAEGGS